MKLSSLVVAALALANLTACLDARPDDAATGEATEPIGTGGGSLACSKVCSSASACDQPCIDDVTGTGSSCGAHGLCVSCASSCGPSSPCDQVCAKNGFASTCAGAGATCSACTDAYCDAHGCATTCETSAHTYPRCGAFETPRGDKDSDGLPDALEDQLARVFLPNIYLTGPSADNRDQFYATRASTDPLLRVPYVVRKVPPLAGARAGWCAQGQCVEIDYGLPYNWDTGMPDTGWYAHRGDFEHVAVLVAYKRADDEANGGDWGTSWAIARTDASVWYQIATFWSAHQCESWDFDNSTFGWPYEGGKYRQAGLSSVYVSDGKHANYDTKAACDNVWDQCPDPANVRTDVLDALFNAGESVGVSDTAAGYVCPGFDRTIAYPGVTASSTPIDSPPYDVWGAASFGTSNANAHAIWMRAGSLDWGRGTYACP